MKKDNQSNSGIKTLIMKYKNEFRIPENLNYYSDEDFKKAERCYLKFLFNEGGLNIDDSNVE